MAIMLQWLDELCFAKFSAWLVLCENAFRSLAASVTRVRSSTIHDEPSKIIRAKFIGTRLQAQRSLRRQQPSMA